MKVETAKCFQNPQKKGASACTAPASSSAAAASRWQSFP
nr:MAG TPA: hypothetical protein [Caudoviricetes sp.]